MKTLLLTLISVSLVNNVVLSQFLGLCPFLGVSKKIEPKENEKKMKKQENEKQEENDETQEIAEDLEAQRLLQLSLHFFIDY